MKAHKRIIVRVHPAGWAALLVLLLFLPSHLVLGTVLALLWHEAAHTGAMLVCGIRHCVVEMTPFGGMADAKGFEQLHPLSQMLCAAAGVSASAAGAWFCTAFLPKTTFSLAFFHAHLSLAVFNCIPAWPLDGARVLTAVAMCFGMENRARKCMAFLSQVLGFCMVIAALFGAWKGHYNLSMLLAGPYLCYAAQQGYMAERIRRICFFKDKTENGAILPVHALITRRKDVSAVLPALIGRQEQQRYYLLLQLGEDGELKRIWTEKEMLDAALECIDMRKEVDKTN